LSNQSFYAPPAPGRLIIILMYRPCILENFVEKLYYIKRRYRFYTAIPTQGENFHTKFEIEEHVRIKNLSLDLTAFDRMEVVGQKQQSTNSKVGYYNIGASFLNH
jgi:hypothetical protein